VSLTACCKATVRQDGCWPSRSVLDCMLGNSLPLFDVNSGFVSVILHQLDFKPIDLNKMSFGGSESDFPMSYNFYLENQESFI